MHDAHDMHDVDSSAMHDENVPGAEDSDDSVMRKPKGMDPADALDWMLDRLCEKLDDIAHREEKILGRYILDGADNRRQGGASRLIFFRQCSLRFSLPIALHGA